MNDEAILLKRKNFIESVYVKGIKNLYFRIYLFLQLINIDTYNNENIEQINNFLNNVDLLTQTYYQNLNRVVEALRKYNKLIDYPEYKQIKEFWIVVLPKLLPDLKITCKVYKRKKNFVEFKNKLNRKLDLIIKGSDLLNEIQKVLYGNNALFSDLEREKLDK